MEAWATATSEAYLVDTERAERPAEAEAEAEPECVLVGVAFAAAGLAEQVWGTLRFGYGR